LVKPIKMQDIYNTLSRLYKKGTLPVETISNSIAVETTPVEATILIAEDNTVNMLLAKTIVKKIVPNAIILEAKNGLEVVQFYKTQMPDLILMDIQMPEMNGYEATQKVREMEHGMHIPIIALTAGNVKNEEEKCLAAGMDAFVIKPFVEETIALLLDKWLHTEQKNDKIDLEIKNQDTAAHFDLQWLKTCLGDNEGILKEVMGLTREELIQSASALQMHVDNKDIQGLNATGHKLYGTSVSAGLTILARIANEFEHINDFVKTDAEKLLAKAKAEIDTLLKILSKYK